MDSQIDRQKWTDSCMYIIKLKGKRSENYFEIEIVRIGVVNPESKRSEMIFSLAVRSLALCR